MKIKSLLILGSAVLLWTACSDETPDKSETKSKKKPAPKEVYAENESAGEYEDYMAVVDSRNDFFIGSSMFYSKNPDISGENYQVYLLLDSTSNIVRIEEQYTKERGGSLLRNFHYFKDGDRVASKEYFNKGEGENELFYERVTYYEDGKPVTSKLRSNRFEEYLENELFKIVSPVSCPLERAQRAIAQEGEFQTNFMGVTKNAGLFYIEVGEGDPKGYSTNLLVQQVTPLVQDMINNPNKYKGKKVKVDFREMPDGQGFTFQALMGIEMAK
ncbi:MAG: hypothetical protein ACFHU9_09250 [Fluviicola sp.]